MKTATIGFPRILLGLAVLFSVPPVHAEDIEVYFSNPEGGGQANILMLMDTSGSMDTNECVEWDPSDSNDSNDCIRKNKRLDELQVALKRVIDSLASNVSIGLEVYNQNEGGRILYPVKPLDQASFDGATETWVSNDAGDAFEQNGSVQAHVDDWAMPNAYDAAGAGTGGGHVGFWFEGVDVPRHAKVTNAYVRVRAADNSNDLVDYKVRYQENFNSRDFDDNPDVVGRLPAVADQAGWVGTISGNWTTGEYYRLDVTDAVNAAISEGTWCGGKNLTLIFTHTTIEASDRLIASRDATLSATPQLVVEWDHTVDPTVSNTNADSNYEESLACRSGLRYSLGSQLDDGFEDASENQTYLEESNMDLGGDDYVGLRFTRIPFDATSKNKPDVINSARLHFIGDNNSRDFNLTVRAMPGNQPEFEKIDGGILKRTLGTETATKTIPKGDFSNAQVMDVTNVVREALSDDNWVRNGALGLRLEASESVIMNALENGSAYGAILEINGSSPYMAPFLPRVRDELKEAVDSITAFGSTPSMEAYSEGARYMLGKKENFAYEDVDSSYYKPDTFVSGSTTQYKSPLTASQCGSNNIVNLTNGSPSNDAEYSAVTSLTGKNSCNGGLNREGGSYNCQVQLAEWLYDGTRNGVGVPISTHAVSFTSDPDIIANMRRVTKVGDGEHRSARNAKELQAAFEDIINSVTVENASMAAPGVAVNQLNRFEFLNQLYYAVFKPSMDSVWLGNLKRYKLDDSTDPAVIRDETGLAAVDPNDGFFKDTASSWWDTVQDGQNVAEGGASQQLVPADRKLFVMTSNPGTDVGKTAISPGALSSPVLFDTFDAVEATKLGLDAGADNTTREQLFSFLKDAWGDPLHSEPRLVNYGFSGTLEQAFNDPSKQDNTVFVSTNDGMLHAINTSDGSEYFTFMPSEMLAQTKLRFDNPKITENPLSRSTYGLDSSWTAWRQAGANGQAAKVYLYGGMRRGGRNYYALDVTDRSAPKVMWSIQGGSGEFANLAQTWSEPTLAAVRINGSRVPVIIFGGGYSAADHDTEGDVSNGDAAGNSIYIVNAYTGDLIWEGSDTGADTNNGDMDYSIPSSIAVIDFDLDGAVDFLYASDLGGQVFRVDINNGNSGTGGLVTRVETVAKLGITDGSGIGDHRRFYASPVVAAGKRNGNTTLQVVIGSGYRAHPLDKQTQDRVYLVDDAAALTALNNPGSFTSPGAVTESDLLDLTTNTSPAQADLDASSGWYINLTDSGEKVMAPAAVLQGKIFFTTYVPEVADSNQCSNVLGTARLYIADLATGAPAGDFDNDGSIDSSRYQDQKLRGLPPQPQVLVGVGGDASDDDDGDGSGDTNDPCEDGGKITVLTGTATASGGTLKGCGLQKTRWYETNEDEADNTINIHDPVN